MIISEITIKNFKSFGNNEQTLKLNTNKGELILLAGSNGNGKSSLIESFEYILYGAVKSGKTKKWATLSSLPNRINGELLTKIVFTSGGTEVKIERGYDPAVLKLTENGVLNERAGKTNINDLIEKYIGFDVETFKSFISMSVNHFKNFISLSNEEKQILLDKLFNLEVINLLNSILKDLNKSNKNLILKHETEISTLEQSINSIRQSILKSLEKEQEDIQGEIESIKQLMESQKSKYAELKEKVEKIKLKDQELKQQLDKEREAHMSIQNELRNTQKSIDLYNSGKCPTCQTPFDSEHFVSLLETLIEKKKSSEGIMNEIGSNINALREKQKKLGNISEETTKSFNDITWLLKSYKQQIDKLQLKANSNEKTSSSVEEFQKTIDELLEKQTGSRETCDLFKEKEIYYKELSKIFSDEGVKKSIISGIIKPINIFISENIKHMGLPFQVELDETFSAKIKQFGIEVEHDSLSLGETKKLNLCFLMAYLKLIRTKKNVNILFLDEVFSSLDMESIESVLFLLKDFSTNYNVNIFVVHHSIMNQEWFDRIIEIRKNVFSEIIYIK
jgi:DNA repair exonuclease SbcCD ATPase subunit